MSEKVTDIQARHDAAGDGRRMDLGDGWQAHDDRGELLAEIARLRAPATDARTPDDPLHVPAAGCDGCGNDPGQRHAVDCQPLSLAWLGGTREATIAKLPADIAATVGDAPLTPSERAELMERASPATRTFLAAVKAGASVADLETVLRAYAAEDRERKAWAAVAPPSEPDIKPAVGE